MWWGTLVVNGLTQFMPLISLYTLWKHQKTRDFLFLGGTERHQGYEMDEANAYTKLTIKYSIDVVSVLKVSDRDRCKKKLVSCLHCQSWNQWQCRHNCHIFLFGGSKTNGPRIQFFGTLNFKCKKIWRFTFMYWFTFLKSWILVLTLSKGLSSENCHLQSNFTVVLQVNKCK